MVTNASRDPQLLTQKLYTASATAITGREGLVKSSDGNLEVRLTAPRALGGPGGTGTNPEQLFAAGFAACFGSAIGHVARLNKVQTGPVSVTTNVSIGPAGRGFGLEVELVVDLPEMARDQAENLVKAAHEVCPYSNATRGNIVVDVRVA